LAQLEELKQELIDIEAKEKVPTVFLEDHIREEREKQQLGTKNELPKDKPKTEPAKEKPKTEPSKEKPKTEPSKEKPKPEPSKDKKK